MGHDPGLTGMGAGRSNPPLQSAWASEGRVGWQQDMLQNPMTEKGPRAGLHFGTGAGGK